MEILVRGGQHRWRKLASNQSALLRSRSLASEIDKMTGWDTTIALAFAAEELLFAAQAITSDAISPGHGFGIAHYRIRVVSENGGSLPADIARRVALLDSNYTDRESSGATDTAGANSIVAATLDLLSNVQSRLAKSQRDAA